MFDSALFDSCSSRLAKLLDTAMLSDSSISKFGNPSWYCRRRPIRVAPRIVK